MPLHSYRLRTIVTVHITLLAKEKVANDHFPLKSPVSGQKLLPGSQSRTRLADVLISPLFSLIGKAVANSGRRVSNRQEQNSAGIEQAAIVGLYRGRGPSHTPRTAQPPWHLCSGSYLRQRVVPKQAAQLLHMPRYGRAVHD